LERLRGVNIPNPLRSLRPSGVGLDIDQGAIKAAQLSTSGGEYALRHLGYRRLPPRVISEGEVADHDLLVSELKEFWNSHSFKGNSVLLGLSNQRVVVRLLEMPRMSSEDLKGAIGFEAQEYVPMPLEEAVLDHVVVGPSPENEDMDRVLIVAAQREMIFRYTSALRSAGLRPAGIDVKALSLVRSTLPEDLFSDEGGLILLDVGSENTDLALVEKGSPVLVRLIPAGFAEFTGAAASASGFSEEDAEGIITDQGFAVGREAERLEESESEELDPVARYDIRRGVEESIRALGSVFKDISLEVWHERY
jgi:type IV pilus assembly protein PilM